MSDHELLLRHAARWADKRRLTLDTALLETVLDLRDFHDEERPQAWPEGSAEHLMLVRWPSHGPAEVPDTDQLVGTLETFWKFLRGSGRMATGSADPKVLTKEARRAAPRMAQLCADPANHSATKSLQEFGRSIGISLDGAGSIEELQERMDEITTEWNALPIEERRRRSPGPTAHQGSLPGQRATSLAQTLTFGPLGGAGGMSSSWFDDTEVDEDEMMPRRDPAVVARQVQQSPFVQQVLRLANWVGQEGREVTATGALRLAQGRAAYHDLGLRAWEVRREAQWPTVRLLGQDPADPDDALEGLRSSRDLRSLDRLWTAATNARLVEVGSTKAHQVPVTGRSAEGWGELGMLALLSLFLNLPGIRQQDIVFGVLLKLVAGREVDIAEAEDWWWANPKNSLATMDADGSDEVAGYLRDLSDGAVHAALTEMADAGVWDREGGVLHQTDLGYEFGLLLAAATEHGLLDDEAD